ncbi:MAG: hypothetical protein ACE5I3_09105 [Phycisphaerae bacterium]
MQTRFGKLGRPALCLLAAIVMSSLWSPGCASGTSALSLIGTPFVFLGSTAPPSTGGTGDESTFFDTGSRANIDPCSEPNARKFIRISMRNLSTDSFIHYFLVLIALVNGETYPDGAVCPDDIDLYTQNGYTEIPEAAAQEFGNYCIEGPALIYFHQGGQFRRGGGAGGSQLASAIAPAQGTNATFDNFFTSGGVPLPVPNLILFHNPGTGEGAALKISFNATSPCAEQAIILGDANCDQDAFYYVDESDLITGSNALGVGSGRRVPSEIQGTGCECTGFQDPFQHLAPSGTAASGARCNEFLRGGLIQYVFVREDTNPPFPQLLWRVTDQSGAEVHDFDPRGNIP